MLYPKPIIIAVCCAIAIAVGVYLGGQTVFETERISDASPVTSTQKPTTPSTPTESTETREKVDVESLHSKIAERNSKIASLRREREALEQKVAALEQTLAKLKAQKKARQEQRQEQHERNMAEIEEFKQWLHTEILPEMNALLPDIAFFFDEGIEPSMEAFFEKYPDPTDRTYHANKFARYLHYLDRITTRVANSSESFQKRFIRVGVKLWGEEAAEYLESEINRKRGK